MDWKTLYDARTVSAEEAVRRVSSGQRVYLTGNCSVPQRLLNALVKAAPNLQDVEICQPLTVAGTE
jgi:4-hydroxybutyrate CoA-transferase